MNKKSSLFLAALLIPAAAAAQSSECIEQPSCEDLGYTQSLAECAAKDLPFIRCPFSKTAVFCGKPATEQIEQTKPHVGDLKYSLYANNHDGWLRCDGTQYSQTKYKNLYNVIGTQFCRTYSSRTDTGTSGKCSSGKFAVPDYRGFFLRGYKYPNLYAVDKLTSPNWPSVSNALYYKGNYFRYGGNTSDTSDSLYIPEYERLPNISGTIWARGGVAWQNVSGAFSLTGDGQPQAGSNRDAWELTGLNFNAKSSNPIYDGSHVVPANYAAHIFIYAGE